MARRTTRWFLSLQATLYLVLVMVRGSEDADDAYKNGRNLVLEYFLPINLPAAVDAPLRREKRDVEEGSGEDETIFSEISGKKLEDADNSTQSAFTKFMTEEEEGEREENSSNAEGSGEIEEVSESSENSSEEKSVAPIIAGGEVFTTTESEEVVETTKTPENRSEVATEVLTSTEMIFDKSEDFEDVSTSETEDDTTTAAVATEVAVTAINTTVGSKDTTDVDSSSEETTTEQESNSRLLDGKVELTTPAVEESTTAKHQTTTVVEETTTILPTESVTIIPLIPSAEDDVQSTKLPTADTTTAPPDTTTLPERTTTESSSVIPVVVPHVDVPVEAAVDSTTTTTTARPNLETTKNPTAEASTPAVIPQSTEGIPVPPPPPPTTPGPIVEEIFQETKVGKKLEAIPGHILQKENLSLAADPLLIANTRLMDSEENVQLSSSEPKRLGAYIVIGLILLSFSSLVGYITFRKRMNRKRQEFESNQESHDTEKALLSLSEYKDNSELEENHLKNNEITPIVVKSNSQINKFEKNTNFSSPKNLNTIANEKNIEKDNVLKSTAENLTQVIIEDSPKDLEEEKNVPNLEKLIVKTRIDQDSIPKKPIIINRTCAGYLPIPQDNS